MIMTLWLAAIVCMTITFRISMRYLNDGMFRYHRGHMTLDVGIPIGSTISTLVSGAITWLAWTRNPVPMSDAIALPLALLGTSTVISGCMLGAFLLSYSDPRSGSLEYRRRRLARRG